MPSQVKDQIEASHFRTVLRYFATGVTVVTAWDDDEPVGLVANSFTSVSLDPPLVLWSAAKPSRPDRGYRAPGAFAVNISPKDRPIVPA